MQCSMHHHQIQMAHLVGPEFLLVPGGLLVLEVPFHLGAQEDLFDPEDLDFQD